MCCEWRSPCSTFECDLLWLAQDKWVCPGNRLEIREMLEYLDTVASFSPVRYCLKAKGGQASRIAAVTKSSQLEGSSLDVSKEGSVGGSCWGRLH